jgi:type III secretory pathway component EscT
MLSISLIMGIPYFGILFLAFKLGFGFESAAKVYFFILFTGLVIGVSLAISAHFEYKWALVQRDEKSEPSFLIIGCILISAIAGVFATIPFWNIVNL